jgi:hypothetical protein
LLLLIIVEIGIQMKTNLAIAELCRLSGIHTGCVVDASVP